MLLLHLKCFLLAGPALFSLVIGIGRHTVLFVPEDYARLRRAIVSIELFGGLEWFLGILSDQSLGLYGHGLVIDILAITVGGLWQR